MHLACAILLFTLSFVFWTLNLLSLPGNWMIFLAVAVYAFFMPPDQRVDVGLPVAATLAGMALTSELVEFGAGTLRVRRAGGSKRGAVLALFGSMAGSVIGLFVGLPIPVFGQMTAVLLFASTGALVGAVAGELWAGRQLEQSMGIGHAAFWGQLLGTMGKVMVGLLMIVLLAVALVV